MARGAAPLFHGSRCERWRANDIASGIDAGCCCREIFVDANMTRGRQCDARSCQLQLLDVCNAAQSDEHFVCLNRESVVKLAAHLSATRIVLHGLDALLGQKFAVVVAEVLQIEVHELGVGEHQGSDGSIRLHHPAAESCENRRILTGDDAASQY